MRVKLGIDPTAPDIHLGHVVVLQRLRDFKDAGHTVVLIVGDYTARVGDPSGALDDRPVLPPEEIDRNAATFQEQAFHILDRDRVERCATTANGWTWLPRISFAWPAPPPSPRSSSATTSPAATPARPISVLELLYPLLQGYGSVAIEAGVELGDRPEVQPAAR